MQHPELRHSYDDEISSDEIHHDVGTAEIGTSEDYDCVSNNDENIHHQPPRVMSIKTRGVMLSMRDEDPNHRWLARPAASPSKGIKSIDGPSSMISSKKVPSTTPNTIKVYCRIGSSQNDRTLCTLFRILSRN